MPPTPRLPALWTLVTPKSIQPPKPPISCPPKPNSPNSSIRSRPQHTNMKDFVREREATDKANGFLNHGNYLAYGLAATTLWVLGIPHGFAVMHGKTRRGCTGVRYCGSRERCHCFCHGRLSVPWKMRPSRNFASNACKPLPTMGHWTSCLNRSNFWR